MTKSDYLSRLSFVISQNDWDLPSPGRVFDFARKYHGPDKEKREAIKEYGRKLQENVSVDDKIIGYGLEAYGHFYRSLEASINLSRKHPENFYEYFQHWLHSDLEYVSNDARTILVKMFPKPKPLKIGKGKSYWNTK